MLQFFSHNPNHTYCNEKLRSVQLEIVFSMLLLNLSSKTLHLMSGDLARFISTYVTIFGPVLEQPNSETDKFLMPLQKQQYKTSQRSNEKPTLYHPPPTIIKISEWANILNLFLPFWPGCQRRFNPFFVMFRTLTSIAIASEILARNN